MLRFILKKKWRDGISGAEGEYFETLDSVVPKLQEALSKGGFGESGYDMVQLVGVEVLPDEAEGGGNG